MKLIDWLFGRSSLGVISGWTPARSAKYEREMLTRLGRVAEPSYEWHAKLLKRQQRRMAEALRFRRSA